MEISFNISDDGQAEPLFVILKQPDNFVLDNQTGIATWTPTNDSVSEIQYYTTLFLKVQYFFKINFTFYFECLSNVLEFINYKYYVISIWNYKKNLFKIYLDNVNVLTAFKCYQLQNMIGIALTLKEGYITNWLFGGLGCSRKMIWVYSHQFWTFLSTCVVGAVTVETVILTTYCPQRKINSAK